MKLPAPDPRPAPLRILFHDRRFVVIDKQAGVPAHPARGDRTRSVEERFGELGRFRNGPWLAHRLDRDTAGCLVVALRRTALYAAQECFASGRAKKTYWAVVAGVPEGTEGEVTSRLGRIEQGRSWRMAATPDGALATTRWRVIGVNGATARLELTPLTGRTHQIRAHCAALGCPIVGDGVYGSKVPVPLHLLARAIRLQLVPPVEAQASIPAHMRALWPE